MTIRMTGMMSGLDTDAIIKELMSAQSMKKTKIEQKKTKAEWKQEKWAELNKKIYGLYTKQVSKMKLQGSYLTKKVTSSNEDAVTATATSSAATGSHTLEVKQLASSQYVTSASIKNKGAKSSSTLDSLGVKAGTVITVKTGTGENEKEVSITVNSKTTIKDFVTHLQDAGLNASFDEKQGRFFISSKESGAENAFTIQTYQTASGSAKETLENAIGKTTDTLISFYEAVKAGNETNELKTKLIEEAKANEKANQLASVANDYVENTLKKDNTLKENEIYFGIDVDGKAVLPAYDTDGKITNFTTEALDKAKAALGEDVTDPEEIRKKAQEMYEATLGEVAAKYVADNEADILANDPNIQLAIDAAGTSADNAVDAYITEVKAGGTGLSSSNVLNNIGLTNIDGTGKLVDATGKSIDSEGYLLDTNGARVDADGDGVSDKSDNLISIVSATDAKIVLDGAELTDTSNSFSVAGLNLELKNVTTGKISLNTTGDADAVYDSFKEFIKEYNSILEEMNTLYGADSARGYEPLTDEEKEAMSEEQIELWEKKIKDSLLRRDSTLNSLTSAMRTAMQTTIKASDGKTYSLSSFGIMTSSDYTEKGLLHIYGDEDDEDYGTEENKLKKALQENPDIVAEVLSGIVTQLSNTMSDKMKGTEVSSALTFYNDKEMKNQIKDYEDEITRWEDKLLDLEDRYYKQFSAMETALAKLNSQSNYLASMLGTSA